MKLGRFVVETHCHGQRHAVRIQERGGDADYGSLADMMKTAVPADEAGDDDPVVVYDNSDHVLYDMETYGVDMAVLLPGFGMTNEINAGIIEEPLPKTGTGKLDRAGARGETEPADDS